MNLTRTIFISLSVILLSACSKDELPKEDIHVAMIDAINVLRASGCQCGDTIMPPVNPLRWNNSLETAAGNHAKDMSSKNYFSHISPNGLSPIQRALSAGYEGEYVGENIGRNYSTVKQVVDAWKNSEGHCKAMMDSLYNEMGAEHYDVYWVLDFGRSK